MRKCRPVDAPLQLVGASVREGSGRLTRRRLCSLPSNPVHQRRSRAQAKASEKRSQMWGRSRRPATQEETEGGRGKAQRDGRNVLEGGRRGGQSHATWQIPFASNCYVLKRQWAPHVDKGALSQSSPWAKTQRQAGRLTLLTRRDSEAGSKPSRKLQTDSHSIHHITHGDPP